jgi:hypothetical protein
VRKGRRHLASLGSASFDSRGELRLAERLKDFLEDHSYIWHNLPVGPRGRHREFGKKTEPSSSWTCIRSK